MQKFMVIVPLIFITLLGCSKNMESPMEPQGTPVNLTNEDIERSQLGAQPTQKWYMWHTKGLRLNGQGKSEEALYCFHQAMNAWPKNFTAEQLKLYPERPKDEPTDTILQLGYLYIELNKPQLAIYYFKKYENYFPNDTICHKGLLKAQEMISESPDTYRNPN